jgi:hypothetical protein
MIPGIKRLAYIERYIARREAREKYWYVCLCLARIAIAATLSYLLLDVLLR